MSYPSGKWASAVVVAVGLAVLMAVPAFAAPRTPRNVIIILSDDHRYDFMSFMKQAPDWLETPGMDRLAAGGAHIANAFVTTSLCSPSRASILTGQYAHRHRVVDNTSGIPEGTKFFPELLHDAGWRTAYIGKWHMGEDADDPRPGFDHWVGFRGQGTYNDPVLNIDGRRQEIKGYTTDILTRYALDWLKSEARDDGGHPFFLMLSHKAVHAEFVPAERHAGRYRDVAIPYPETMPKTESNLHDQPRWVQAQRNSWHGVDYAYHGQFDFDTFYRRYAETTLALDESVGAVLDFVQKSKFANNTLIIYLADNGFSLGEHGLIDKRQAYEESMRIPMIAWAPGFVPAGVTVTDIVRNIDIAPTILDLAGVKATRPIDGRSVLPLLRGESMDSPGELLYEYYWEHAFPQTPTTFALRGDRFKYIYYQGVWDTQELFDLSNDPHERHNLFDLPEYRDTGRAMRNRLFDKLDETGGMQIMLRRGDWQADERLIP